MSTQYRTKNWVLTLIITIFIIGYVLIFLFFGQPDLLNLDWFIPHNGLIWSGVVNESNFDQLKTLYPTNEFVIDSSIAQGLRNLGGLILSINILYVFLIALAVNIIAFAILKIFHVINWDLLTFLIPLYFAFCLCYFACAIPIWDKNNDLARIIVIMVITIIPTIAIFLICNNIITHYIATGKFGFAFFNDLMGESKSIKYAQDSYDELMKKKNQEKDYIEVKK